MRYGWATEGGRVEREHSAAFIETSALEDQDGRYQDQTSGQRFWSLRGYVAEGVSLAHFTGVAVDRGWDEGAPVRHRAARVTLAFSSPPSSLPADGECELTVEIALEALVELEIVEREASFVFPCSVRERTERLMEIVVSDWRAQDADENDLVPLAEAPRYGAARAWREPLEEEGYAERWPEPLYSELLMAFSPDLLFDSARPDVIFPRALDFNSPSPSTYTQVAPGTPADWWDTCPEGAR